jgi:hypothetical protein
MRVTPRQSIGLMVVVAGLFAVLAALAARASQTWPAWVFGALSAVCVASAVAMWRNPRLAAEAAAAFLTPEEGLWIDPQDPLFLQARARATQTNDRMMALHRRFPGEVLVKLPWQTDGGKTERVWAELHSADGQDLMVRMVSRPVAHHGAVPEALRVPAEGIDDWLLETEEGVHGAWSVQAELALAQREGVRVPDHVAAMRGRFLDPLEGS